jgi:hypothetical protein
VECFTRRVDRFAVERQVFGIEISYNYEFVLLEQVVEEMRRG